MPAHYAVSDSLCLLSCEEVKSGEGCIQEQLDFLRFVLDGIVWLVGSEAQVPVSCKTPVHVTHLLLILFCHSVRARELVTISCVLHAQAHELRIDCGLIKRDLVVWPALPIACISVLLGNDLAGSCT